jgi:hypothetical protein
MPWSGNPLAVDIGPGKLWVASLSAAAPTNATSALDESDDGGADGNWVPIGYTEEGSTFTYEVSSEGIEVAEELDEIASRRTSAVSKVAFAMAEATARNLTLALNGGLVPSPTTIEPVDLDDEERVQLVFEADNGARWLYRKCYNIGNVEVTNAKAPAKRLIAVEFKLEKPAVGKPWTIFPNPDGLI